MSRVMFMQGARSLLPGITVRDRQLVLMPINLRGIRARVAY